MSNLTLTIFDPNRKVNVSPADFSEAFRLLTFEELKWLENGDYYFFRAYDKECILYTALTIECVLMYKDYVNIYAGGGFISRVTGEDDRIIKMRSLEKVLELKQKYSNLNLV